MFKMFLINLIFIFAIAGPVSGANYYEILGVDPSATEEEIKRAYKISATKLHKKYGSTLHPEFKKNLEIISKAKAILTDTEKRKAYSKSINIDYEWMQKQRAEREAAELKIKEDQLKRGADESSRLAEHKELEERKAEAELKEAEQRDPRLKAKNTYENYQKQKVSFPIETQKEIYRKSGVKCIDPNEVKGILFDEKT